MQNARSYGIALVCLLIGALVYIACRIDILFVQYLHLPALPAPTWNTDHPLVYWIVFCLPDGLWYFALLLVQYKFLQRDSSISRLCACTAVLLPFALEMLQALGCLRGTFDWYDIITYLFTLILFVLCVKKDFC